MVARKPEFFGGTVVGMRHLQIMLLIGLFSCAPKATNECGEMDSTTCGIEAFQETDWERRRALAIGSCALGDPKGCGVLGRQLLLDSADDEHRLLLSYRAFHRSCSDLSWTTCATPALVELGTDAPNVDIVLNHTHRMCTGGATLFCDFDLALRVGWNLPVSADALSEARAVGILDTDAISSVQYGDVVAYLHQLRSEPRSRNGALKGGPD